MFAHLFQQSIDMGEIPKDWSLANICPHLDEHKLLADRQHAFRKRHSCKTRLITVINDWAKLLDNGGQVDTFNLDFEKAFDTSLMNYLNASRMVMVLVKRF